MSEVQQPGSLEVGEIFDRDLVDNDGNVMLRAGHFVSESFLRELAAAGVLQLHISEEVSELSPYAPEDVRKLQRVMQNAPAVLDDLSARIRDGERIDPSEIDDCVREIGSVARADPSIVLASAISGSADLEISARNLRFSAMAMVAAKGLGYPPSDCRAVARAALLCDVALEPAAIYLEQIPQNTSEYDAALANYLEHPRLGCEMLRRSLPEVDQLELILVAQVHEQCDGSGFPRGLRKHHLHPLSRLLNLIDAFLTLTDPRLPSGCLVPADALAYLVGHALYGTFDRECVRGLVSATAVYPIGTEVLLNDASTAIVMRSGGAEYMKPIIQLKHTSDMLDLRDFDREIVSPAVAEAGGRRIRRDEMGRVLWMRAA